jgi:hypothetical protein
VSRIDQGGIARRRRAMVVCGLGTPGGVQHITVEHAIGRRGLAARQQQPGTAGQNTGSPSEQLFNPSHAQLKPAP